MEQNAEKLRELLSEKRDILCKIWESTQGQAALLQLQDAEELLKSIEQRQVLIDEIDDIDTKTKNLVPTGETENEKMGAVHRMFPNIWDEIMTLLKSITEQDAQNNEVAAAILKEYKARIREVGQTRETVGNYIASQDFGEGIYFDSKK